MYKMKEKSPTVQMKKDAVCDAIRKYYMILIRIIII